jgi:hypothetical protein
MILKSTIFLSNKENGGLMSYTNIALEDKILDMYPEIRKHDIAVSLTFSEEKNSYIVKFKKDTHTLETYIDKSDADECMDGVKCVHLGIKLGEFIEIFETGN